MGFIFNKDKTMEFIDNAQTSFDRLLEIESRIELLQDEISSLKEEAGQIEKQLRGPKNDLDVEAGILELANKIKSNMPDDIEIKLLQNELYKKPNWNFSLERNTPVPVFDIYHDVENRIKELGGEPDMSMVNEIKNLAPGYGKEKIHDIVKKYENKIFTLPKREIPDNLVEVLKETAKEMKNDTRELVSLSDMFRKS